jgi:hypothetical protein
VSKTLAPIPIIRIVGEKGDTDSTWKKLSQCGEKNHGKTDLLCVVKYRVQGGPIYIGKGDRDSVT